MAPSNDDVRALDNASSLFLFLILICAIAVPLTVRMAAWIPIVSGVMGIFCVFCFLGLNRAASRARIEQIASRPAEHDDTENL
ncbi:MAG: hypothetical protein G01um1014106_301 [Parcubacteria group bacterium Gr01-1014_106]|nr:MAG: hypothetical protein G01um1014106_301 [Parcubacteria group bacterium Gr01-1014_106]